MSSAVAAVFLVLIASSGFAHFGMAVPSSPEATAEKRSLEVLFSFSHPFAGQGMELVKPQAVSVHHEGEAEDLLAGLSETEVMGHKAWKAEYRFKRPGVYNFYMEPKPYWEPAEDCFIVHHTKVAVPAFGGDQGWAAPIGVKTEIVPLLRPFGNYAGNAFVGQVLLDGKPVPGAEVEVELYNREGYEMPSEYHETQVVTADENGVFTFVCPKPGWWGFAALNTADYRLEDPGGEKKDVELGAVFWTYMHPWSK
jgi:cobalt/nickel transport protein